jgi:formylglycine-generating enzyme required for sulfatase activity
VTAFLAKTSREDPNYPDGLRLYSKYTDALEAQKKEAHRLSVQLAEESRIAGSLVAGIEAHMLNIPAGSFQMGSGFRMFDLPVHTVAVGSFKLSAYDVVFDQYDLFARTTGRSLPDGNRTGRGSLPASGVQWEDAQAFISWLNQKSGRRYRLPSEAEWEYAARAGATSKYYWGEEFDEGRANNNHQSPTIVGSFPPNPWGLYDMSGDVWQWTQDCAHNNYVGAPTDGSSWTSGDCGNRVARGGAWNSIPTCLWASSRAGMFSACIQSVVGFRLAEDL